MKKNETLTIGYTDNPTHTLAKGHVDPKTFNKLYAAEGWEADPVDADDLKYEYWVPLKRSWKKAHPGKKGAVAVTVLYW